MLIVCRTKAPRRGLTVTGSQHHRTRRVAMHEQTGHRRRPMPLWLAMAEMHSAVETESEVKKCSLTAIGKVSTPASRIQGFLKNPDEQKALEQGGEESLPEDLRDQFWKLNKGLIVWGSPAVIKSWLHFRKVTTTGGNTFVAMDNVLKAIRKDLGNSNVGLQAIDLVKVFLRDPGEADRAIKADKNV